MIWQNDADDDDDDDGGGGGGGGDCVSGVPKYLGNIITLPYVYADWVQGSWKRIRCKITPDLPKQPRPPKKLPQISAPLPNLQFTVIAK